MASEPSLDTQLAALRATAKSLQEQRSSWFEHILHPGRHARRQEDFSAAMVETVKQVIASIRISTAKLAETEHETSDLKNKIAELRENQERLGRESAGTVQNLTDRAAEMHQQFEQLTRDHAEKIETLARDHSEKIAQVIAGHGDLGNELRERIQHILDEQRVAIRQLSLKVSEDAILSDRARRATELKLDELAKRLPPSRG